MLTALDADPNALDEHEKNFVANVREHGWFGTHVFADDSGSGFSYSTGFWLNAAAPEIITFGVKESSNAHQALWNVYNDLRKGRVLAPETRISDILDGLDVVLLPVDLRFYRDHLGWSVWFYAGDSFPCLQLVWPDRTNKFPWETGFDLEFANSQPDLTSGAWSGLQQV